MGQASDFSHLAFEEDYLILTFDKDTFDSLYYYLLVIGITSKLIESSLVIFRREIILENFNKLDTYEIYFKIVFPIVLVFVLIFVAGTLLVPRIYKSNLANKNKKQTEK